MNEIKEIKRRIRKNKFGWMKQIIKEAREFYYYRSRDNDSFVNCDRYYYTTTALIRMMSWYKYYSNECKNYNNIRRIEKSINKMYKEMREEEDDSGGVQFVCRLEE